MSAAHRHFPESNALEIERAAMLGIGPLASDLPEKSEPVVERECRDCGGTFTLSVALAAKPQTKWTSLCPFCLAGEC